MRDHVMLGTSSNLTTRLEDAALKLENDAHSMNS
jgi:hypothetical protein